MEQFDNEQQQLKQKTNITIEKRS